MVLSHTQPHGELPSYTSNVHPLHCAIHRESSLSIASGKMDRERFLLSLSDNDAARMDNIGRHNCPLTVFTLCSYHSSVEWIGVFLQ